MSPVLRQVASIVKAVFITILGGIVLFFLATCIDSALHASSDPNLAVSKAQEALLKQSGLQLYIDRAGAYGTATVKRVAYSVFPELTVDTGAFAAVTLYRKRLQVPTFNSPLFPQTKHALTLQTDAAVLTTVVNF